MDNKEGAPVVRMPDTPAPLPEQGLTPSATTTHEAVQPAPLPERSPSLEKNAEKAREMMTPTVARYSAGAVDKKFFKPGEIARDEEEATRIGQEAAKKPADQLPSESLENYSLTARAETTQTHTGWRTDVARWIKQETEDKPRDPESVKAALRSLGIDTTKHGDELDNQINEFSKNYLKKDKSEIKKFAEDLAKGCQDSEGNIDLTQFDQRLHAIGELLNSFGTKDDINLRVRDYAADFALHHQAQKDERVRDVVAEKVAEHIKKPLEGRDRESFSKLYDEEQKAKELRERVRAKLQEAENNPDKTPTAGAAHAEESALQHAFARGEVTKEEFDKKRDEIKAKWKGIARLDSPAELKEALRQLKEKGVYTEKTMAETYKHETDHYNKAQEKAKEHGLPEPFFNIQVTRDKELNSYHPSTQFYLPEDEEEAKRMQEEIILAPGFDDLDSPRHVSSHDLTALGVAKENIEAAIDHLHTPEGQEELDLKKRAGFTENEVVLTWARHHAEGTAAAKNAKPAEEAEPEAPTTETSEADPDEQVLNEEQVEVAKEAIEKGIFTIEEDKLDILGLDKNTLDTLKHAMQTEEGGEFIQALLDQGMPLNEIHFRMAMDIRHGHIATQEGPSVE